MEPLQPFAEESVSGESGARRTVELLEHVLTRLSWLQRRMLLLELGPHGLTVP